MKTKMYIDRMVDLIKSICGSSKLSKTQKSEALGQVVYCILCEGEAEGIEHGDSNATFHELRTRSEQKDKTIVVLKDMTESALHLNNVLHNTRIEWDGSEIDATDVQSLQDELDRRGIVVPTAA